MPNIKSAKKRVEVSEKNRAVNKAYKSELATALKKYNAAVSSEDKEAVKKLYPVTVSLIDESVTRGIIHKNKADRKKADVSSKYIAVATKKAKPAAKVEKVEEVKEPVKEEAPVAAPKAKTTRKPAAKAEKPAEEKVAKPAKKPAAAKTTAKKTAEKK